MSMIAIGVAAVGTAAAVGSAYEKNQAQQAEIGSQENAINGLQPLDINALNSMASSQDLAKYQADFAAQAQYDPLFASMRTQGAQGVLGALASNANPNSIQNQGISNLQTTTNANVKANQPVIDQLLAAAKAELAGGATLPPAFQAEMIRSGLAGGGAAGTGVAGEGATGVGVRTLLGSAGQAYQAQQQGMATQAAGAAGSLEQQQQAALNELTQLSMSLNTQKAALAGGAVAAGNATVPSIGLSGAQDVGFSIANTNLANQQKLAIGGLKGQSALDTGAMYSSMIGAGGSGISSALSAFGSGGSSASVGNQQAAFATANGTMNTSYLPYGFQQGNLLNPTGTSALY